jgi:hypothetical protein
MKIFIFLFAVLFLFAVDAAAQRSPFDDDRVIENKVEQLLLKRGIGEVASELAKNEATTTEALLVRLSVFGRAGWRARVRETLREIGQIYAGASDQTQIYRVVRRAIEPDDVAARKIFYERIAPDGDDGVIDFVYAWRTKGDVRELEEWLAARAGINDTWWYAWVELERVLGKSQEAAAALAQKIRENPSDFALVQKYLGVVSSRIAIQAGSIFSPINSDARYEQDIAWLADVVSTDTAYRAFNLAVILRKSNPAAAVKLLEKSLSLPVTERDAPLLDARAAFYSGAQQKPKNPEKQLRVWTKKALVEIYLETNQAILAQPLVEELTATDMSDVEPDNAYYNAGAVQSGTGMRVVEARILMDEKKGEDSPDYWLNRAAYYAGRGEKAAVWQTLQQALARFAYKPNDLPGSLPRLRLLYDLKWTGENDPEAATGILRNEFVKAKAANDLAYLYRLLWTLNDDYEELRTEFFVNTDLLAKVFGARERWGEEEGFVLGNAFDLEKWDAKKRAAVWEQLTLLARRDVRNRAFTLANVMNEQGEYRRAIPILEECLRIAPVESGADWPFDRKDVEEELFEALLNTNDWQGAEKIWLGGFRATGRELGQVAVAAAKSGKIADAVRVWKLNANIDRRNLSGLEELAKTGAKMPLREFYAQMKQTDALTDAPEKALSVLK